MTGLADFLRARYAEDAQAVRANWNRDGITSERYHDTPIDPTRLLADLDAKLALLEDLLAEEHERNEEDHWYSCAALTDRDGNTLCFDESRAPGPCDCGRDTRINRRLRILARPFAGHTDYQDKWRSDDTR
ncbi:DUF6221 family protein [Streptomyces sp. NPDC059171]|uniref:DUF6221 family protein n=1 Tax=Streptomyces sp. NPDC059171 TaxID=3346755 RepID=UPI0036911054